MVKVSIIFAVYAMAIAVAMPMVRANVARGPEAVESWVGELQHKMEKVTNIHFYLHDHIKGVERNSWQVAQANITSTSPYFFGLVSMADNMLTERPDPKSKAVGQAQGFFGSASLEEIGYLMNYNLVFTEGEYQNSTLSLHGWNPVLREYREMAIIGGSGVFRLARGIATAKTYLFDTAADNVIIEYNLVVIHY